MVKLIKLIRVLWHDTAARAGWFTVEEIEAVEKEPPCLVESVGWLISETDDVVILAQSKMRTLAGELLVIPKAVIKERWEL